MTITNLKHLEIPAPCKRCIVVPICRRKSFKLLVRECVIISDFFYKKMNPPLGYYNSWDVNAHPSLTLKHTSVLKSLKPTKWYVLMYNHDECIIVKSGDFAYVPRCSGRFIKFEEPHKIRRTKEDVI